MKAIVLLLLLIVIVLILTKIINNIIKKKNILISFWIAFSIVTIIIVSAMLLNKEELVQYSCTNKYWEKDFKLNQDFFVQTYGEYKCGSDLRYNNPKSIVYYNELINILISSALIFTVNNTYVFRQLLKAQALNTITYFLSMKDYSNMKYRKSIYLGISSLYFIIPLILAYRVVPK